MKKFFYFIYSFLFRIYRIFPVKENRISFVSPHNAGFNDSLKFVKEEFEKRGLYDYNFVSSNQLGSAKGAFSFFCVNAYKIATSRFVFLNDNFMPFSNVRFSKKTTVVQLWHGQGAFKKFGLSSNLSAQEKTLAKKCSERYDYIVVSSKNVSKIYADAFGVSEEKIISCGIPESDLFANIKHVGKFRNHYNIPIDKKIVLYAPTFRENFEDDKEVLTNFSTEKFASELSEEYQLVVRLHPQIHRDARQTNGAIDATNYDDLNELIIDSDILITDYSSICMEFAYLNKPMIFYAYDLEKYKDERDFYFDYLSYVPGKVVKTMDDLIKTFKTSDFETKKTEAFNKQNFDYFDGKSTQRLVNFLLKNS